MVEGADILEILPVVTGADILLILPVWNWGYIFLPVATGAVILAIGEQVIRPKLWGCKYWSPAKVWGTDIKLIWF